MPTWTEAEDEHLRRMHAARCSQEQMTRQIHRCKAFVSQRLQELGLKRDKPKTLGELLRDAAMTFGSEPFTEQDLAVAAWRRWPLRFGMRGIAQSHPDAKLVSCTLVHRKSGPLAKGWLRRVGAGVLANVASERKASA